MSEPSPALRQVTTSAPPRGVRSDGASLTKEDEARRAFLRMISHEFRTPLNAIIGFSEMIGSEVCGPVPEPYREYGEIIQTSGLRLLKLVNQVLEVIKLESGTAELHLRSEPVDLAFAEALQTVAEGFASRGLQAAFDFDQPAPRVLADPSALRSILSALLQNAGNFAPEGSRVRCIARLHGPLVRLGVRDAGEGVDPSEIARLLKPFEQGDNALTRRNGGVGLGWAIVDRLARAMGGEFTIETAPGEGLCAWITLRRA